MTSASGSRGASFDRVLSAMQAANGGGRVQHGAGYVKVCCPVHGDTDPSCSIRYDQARGKTEVTCFVCRDDNRPILDAAGLTIADLYDEPLPPTSNRQRARRSRNGVVELPPAPQPSATKPAKDEFEHRKVCDYLYLDTAGNRVGKVTRFDLFNDTNTRVGKTFRPMRFNPDTNRWKAGAFDPVIYRAPQIAAAIAEGRVIHLVEGEKDADRGAVALDLDTTTNPGGATSFSTEHARQLSGARVVAVLDRDLAGYERGVRLDDLLFDPDHPVAELRIVEPASGNDLDDHIAAGHGVEDLVDIDPAAKYIALAPHEVERALADGKLVKARAILAKARTLLDKVRNSDERPPLAAGLDEASTLLPTDTQTGEASGPVDELAARRREQHQHRDPDSGPGGPAEPRWSIPTSTGTWAYSTGDDGDGLARGVYLVVGGLWRCMSPLPYVLERLTRRDGQGQRRGISYRLAMRPLDVATDVVICGDDEVKDGSWAEQLDVPLPADDKIVKAVATAIRHTARVHAPLGDITPGWTTDGQLVMPSPDVLGGGYGEIIGTEDNARMVWHQVAEIAGRNPKVALTLGAALGGLFVKPLLIPQRSFWLELVGRGQHGKSTTQRWGASLFGDPERVVETFDTSGKGMTYRFGELCCLPVFLDEIGSSSELGTASTRENTILSTCEGARRRVATRTQGTRNSPPWHGVLLCSGNDSVLDGITNEAVYARVIEVPAPITDSVEDCLVLQNLLAPRDRTQLAYGWPLHWLRQDLSLERFREHIAAAERDLPLPPKGVPKTMGHNLCLIIAGAAELDRLIGSSTLRPAALAAARQVLTQLMDELRERGLTPGERVHTAVTQALVSRVATYPTRSLYLEALPDDSHPFGGSRVALPRDVEGWLITDDADIDGDIAVLANKLPEITAAAGITEPRTGLRELAAAGVLVRSNEAGGKLQRRIRVGKWRPYVYVFRLDADALSELHPSESPTGDTEADPVTRTDAPVPGDDTPSPPSPVAAPVPATQHDAGDGHSSAGARTDAPQGDPRDGVVPGVPGPGTNVACEVSVEQQTNTLLVGLRGPVWVEPDATGTLRTLGQCRECGLATISRDRLGAVHPMCALTQANSTSGAAESTPAEQDTRPPTGPAADPEQRQDRVELVGPCPPRPTGYRAACVVIDTSGIYLPDGVRYHDRQIRDAADILSIGDELRIGHPAGPGQLILTDSMCVELGLVAEADQGAAGDDARDQVRERLGALGPAFLARAREAGWEIGELRPENRARRASDNRVLDIVLGPYEYLWTRGRDEVHPLSALDSEGVLSEEEYAAEAARLMGYLAHLLGGPWRSSAVQVGWDLFDRGQRARKRRRGHVLTQPGRLPELTGGAKVDDLVPALTWSRWTRHAPASEADRDQLATLTHAVHLDRRAAWLASAAQCTLGYVTDDEPRMRHHAGAENVAGLLERPEAIPAGLFRLRLPAADNPAVPPLHSGQSATRPRWLWVPTPFVSTLLADDDPGNNLIGWGCSLSELLTPGDEDEDKQPEAWTFPAQGRLLDGLWYETLRDTRYTLDALAEEGRGDQVATSLIKHVYAGFLQTTQNPTKKIKVIDDERAGASKLVDGPRAWHHQATWLATIKAHHYSWQWNLMRRAFYTGVLVASVQFDEVVVLTDAPDAVGLGQMKGKVGQYKRKKLAAGAMARQLSDEHREQLAAGVPAHELQGGDVP